MAVWLLWLLLLYVISSSLKEMPDFYPDFLLGLCWCKQCWKSPSLDIIPKAFVSRILRRRVVGLKGAACGLRGNMEIYGVFCGSKTLSHGRILITSGKKSPLRSFSVHFSSMLMRAEAVPKALRDGKIRYVATLTPPCTQWFTSTSVVHSRSRLPM